MMIIEMKRKRKESAKKYVVSDNIMMPNGRSDGKRKSLGGLVVGKLQLTEDEFLCRREHVKGEGDFVLIAFPLKPAEQSGRVAHVEEKGSGTGCWYS